LASVTVEPPAGLRFVGHGVGRRQGVAGVAVSGARIRSLSISHGHLVIVLRKAVSRLGVAIGSAALTESGALRGRARAHRLKSLPLTVVVSDTRARRTPVRVQIDKLGL
jgi:hypothetical protein